MVNVGLPVREVPVHGYSVKDEHSADEKDADPLEPPGKVPPAEEISLYKGGEDRKPGPCQSAGGTGKACQADCRADAAEEDIQ